MARIRASREGTIHAHFLTTAARCGLEGISLVRTWKRFYARRTSCDGDGVSPKTQPRAQVTRTVVPEESCELTVPFAICKCQTKGTARSFCPRFSPSPGRARLVSRRPSAPFVYIEAASEDSAASEALLEQSSALAGRVGRVSRVDVSFEVAAAAHKFLAIANSPIGKQASASNNPIGIRFERTQRRA